LRILGIDPGSHVTGWGVIDKTGNYIRHVAFGEIKPAKGLSLSEALVCFSESLTEVIRQFEPGMAVVENIFYGKNVRSLIRQAQVRGVVILACCARHVPVVEYAPLEIKKAVVGYGRAEKRQVQAMIKAILKLPQAPPADAADALAAAVCHANFQKEQRL